MGDATIYRMLNKKAIVHVSVFLCISFMFFRKVFKPLLPQSTAKMGDDDDAVCPVASNKP